MPKRRANGEGNIRKRKDGRWEGRYTVGHDPETGKAIIKNVLGKTQTEVKEMCIRDSSRRVGKPGKEVHRMRGCVGEGHHASGDRGNCEWNGVYLSLIHISCTRAQIVTFLWRAAGSPEPKNMSNFSDVPADSYYAKAVSYTHLDVYKRQGYPLGASNGCTKGISPWCIQWMHHTTFITEGSR